MVRRLLVVAGLALVTVAVVVATSGRVPAADDASPTADPDSPVLVGAGDIAVCSADGDEQTAALLDEIDGTVFTLGDNAYFSGSPENFSECYDPSWGRHRDRTRPAVGGHEYDTPGAAGYFEYFGDRAGKSGQGYYTYRLGDWDIFVLNSNCEHVEGGCGEGSPQLEWFRESLEASTSDCMLAYWHHPAFSSGPHGSDQAVIPLWRTFHAAGGDVVLSADDHIYERFAPKDADGAWAPANGARLFVVGTGGGRLYEFEEIADNSEFRYNDSWGVLKLTLLGDGYEWSFVSVDSADPIDAGGDRCTRRD